MPPPPDPEPLEATIVLESPVEGATFAGRTSAHIPIRGTIDFQINPARAEAQYRLFKDGVAVASGPLQLVHKSEISDEVLIGSSTVGSGISRCVLEVAAHASGRTGRITMHSGGSTELNIVLDFDAAAPALAISEPPDGAQLTAQDGVATVRVVGSASDDLTGVQRVDIAVDDGPFNVQATSDSPVPWARFHADVRIPVPADDPNRGRHLLRVRAIDGRGNASEVSRTVWTPFETAVRNATIESYLQDLIDYVKDHVRKPDGSPVTAGDLAGVFCQPYDLPGQDTEARRVRIAIEVLQKYVKTPAAGDVSEERVEAARRDYLRAAYETLLLQIGTSPAELGRTRVAPAAARQALAARLGVDLPTTRPDPLDRLLLSPSELTEAALERLFGLPETTRGALPPGQSGELLLWQWAHAEALWRQEDHVAAGNAGIGALLVDPDLLCAGDFVPNADGSPGPARALWKERLTWINDRLAALAADRQGQENDRDRLARLVAPILGPMSDLLQLAQTQAAGHDITDELRQRHLTPASFTYLLRLHELTGTLPLVEDEWAAVYSILVQAQKGQKVAEWRLEERNRDLVLGPRYFQIEERAPIRGLDRRAPSDPRTFEIDLTDFDPASAQLSASVEPNAAIADVLLNGRTLGLGSKANQAKTITTIEGCFRPGLNTLTFVTDAPGKVALTGTASPAEPPLPAWRASRLSRAAWLRKLRGRIDQRATIAAALQSVVARAEERALPMFRDGLVDAASPRDDGGVIADPRLAKAVLGERLLIDLEAAGHEKTTRVSQAVQTLQSLLLGLSSKRARHSGFHAVWQGWTLTLPDERFDADFRWYGTYASWKAMMDVFLYPENALLPGLWGKSGIADRRSVSFVQEIVGYFSNGGKLTRGALGAQFEVYTGRLASEVELPELLKARLALMKEIVLGEKDAKLLVDAPDAAAIALIYEQGGSAVREALFIAPVYVAERLVRAGLFGAALDWYRLVLAYDARAGSRKIFPGLDQRTHPRPGETTVPQYQRTEQASLNPHDVVRARPDAAMQFTAMAVARCLLEYADSEFTRDTPESNTVARDLYIAALDVLSADELRPVAESEFAPNPLPEALRLHAEVRLARMRSGRNIAGMVRELPASIADAAGAVVGLPAQAVRARRPTQYRYSVLIERAKQIAGLAAQMESSFLASLEKAAAEEYTLLRARQDLAVADASVDLQQLRVQEALDGVAIARAQEVRAQTQRDIYDGWIEEGLIPEERDMLRGHAVSGTLRVTLAGLNAAISAAQSASSFSLLNPFSWGAAPAGAALSVARGVAEAALAVSETKTTIAGAMASFERRKDEWEAQRSIAERDIELARAQITAADNHVLTARQERRIAALQQEHNSAIVTFLGTKFTNLELYEWMSGVLGQVYAYFLRLASAVARTAEDQLAFERQDHSLAFIQADYWQPPSEGEAGPALDRKGMTGSARLLQDIYQLDQYAFDTHKRKLQLSTTLSLSRLAPLEFQRFRETGQMVFSTPTARFDAEFPGHYLRLIRRVRISIVALIPPSVGVRATLSTTGLSRVVIGGDTFQSVVIRRDPEEIAFVSPVNATGIFELDAQPELLLPFEGMGVDATWELQLPRPTNPFDFSTIADVLMTIEYTALNDADYRKQVLKQLDPMVSGDQALSFSRDLVDAWYELNHPEQSETPMSVRFSTLRTDFLPNMEDGSLAIQHVALYFARADGSDVEVSAALTFSGQPTTPGEPPRSIDGVISTRRGNAAAWAWMLGKSPVQEWTLSLADSEEVRRLFREGEITDILLVITYSGQRMAWPDATRSAAPV